MVKNIYLDNNIVTLYGFLEKLKHFSIYFIVLAAILAAILVAILDL